MQNIKTELKGDKLHLTIDLGIELGESSSGKSMVVASTRGNQAVADSKGNQFKLGVNVYKPID
ncbi:MAG: hypothetical protein ACW98W_19670 [Candidatus Hodarchaeales archaeon]|jgi:hypothetical protein